MGTTALLMIICNYGVHLLLDWILFGAMMIMIADTAIALRDQRGRKRELI
jgi:hypothetical protein